MEPINNAALLSCLLKNNTKLINAIKSSSVRLSIFNEETRITFHCESVELSETLFSYRNEMIDSLKFLEYEIYIECASVKSAVKLERSHAEKEMIALEQQENITEAAEDRLLGLENLASKIGTKEVRTRIAALGAVIYPQADGTESIQESIFNKIALDWMKGDDFPITVIESATILEEEPKSKVKATRQSRPRLLTQEMGLADIATSKGKEGIESDKAIASTLKTFFSRLKLDDITLTDAVAAFIEGNSEYGKGLRKKILTAYKKHYRGANQANIENKLVVGAKQYLEQAASQQIDSVESV